MFVLVGELLCEAVQVVDRRAHLEVLALVLARAALVLVCQVECELFVQLLVARLISGDGVKRRRQTSEIFAVICAQEELVDDATHVHLRLQPTPGLPPAGDAGPHDAAVAAGAAGHRTVVRLSSSPPMSCHGHGERGASRAQRSVRADQARPHSCLLRGDV